MNPKIVLLVEDEPTLIKLITEQLKVLGYLVEPCEDPGTALGKWWLEPTRYRCVLTDWSMFPKNGALLAQALRVLGCEVPILMHSARGADFTREELDRYGVTLYFHKPFDLEMLKTQLDAVLA